MTNNTVLNQGERTNPERTDPISKRAWIVLGALCVASLVGHLVLLPQMPEQIPTHFSTSGEVNGWTDKIAIIPLYALPLLMLALFYFTPKIDPRGSAYTRMGRFYLAFVTVFTLFIICATWTCELSVFGLMPQGGIVMVAVNLVLGAVFIMLGNYMPKIKRNYTFGVKTPWALDNEQNWRLTHRVAGGVLVAAGIVTMACGPLSLVIGDLAIGIMLAAILGGSLAIGVYSYLVFRNGNKPLKAR